VRPLSLLAAPLVLAMTASAAESTPPEADWQRWREQRALALQREDGWLALVGLHWLEEGENRFQGLPGRWMLRAGQVRLLAAPADGWTLAGVPVTDRELGTGVADRLRSGTLQLQVILRAGKAALRVWDSASPGRAALKGPVPAFPYAPRYRVEATFEPYQPPREVETPSVVNLPQRERVPGRVRFTLDGRPHTLEPVQAQDGDELFFVFKDQTARAETYGAGRFLSAAAPRDGKVVLDFNRAINPPCAFTPHATCPLPRPENVLAVRIEAGEKRSHGAGADHD
jgi:uncharacterized protein (DUF1684 family)